jgi:flagellar basal-body rod protein FlgC
MDYRTSFAISAAGMGVERLRVEVAALNLANAHTVSETNGRVFQPLRVIARAPMDARWEQTEAFSSLPGHRLLGPIGMVEAANLPVRKVLEPGHPLADAKGFVSYPGVDTATEMMSLMNATRAYEANVVAMNAARSMALRALDIGG